ncbi:glycosyltransferase [Pacificimonas sp. WHA3]|uniref:Glycosyltransferase n=1 Tax=Pacificimonas pallii TaxID=2827236 RepID=A0ABS6SEA3_9SPHN|nr:glycosyltransferase [Pacificimonas pallii]MBV7256748.1 glycosyltransferase [Pacificimonas pallii]
MLRVLTLSTLYPNAVQPDLGSFCARQTERLAARDDVEVEVIAPVARFPIPVPGAPYSALRDIPERDERGGLSVHHPRYASVPFIGWRWNAKSLARAVVPLARQLHQANPFDVIDCEFFFPDSVAAHEISRALHLPYSIKARGSDIRYWGRRNFTRRQMVGAGRHSNGMLAVSRSLRTDMSRIGLSLERITVHYTGVDLSRFAPDKSITREAGLLLAIGNLVPLKRHLLLIEMMVHLPEYRLEILGEGPERGALESAIETFGVSDRVTLLGRRPHDELAPRLAAAEALVHSSESEGLANVWIEALACGTPVVTTNVGGAAEVVTRDTGVLVPVTATAARFASAVRQLRSRPRNIQAIRAAAEPFSWARNTETLFQHLNSIRQTVK